MVIWLLGISGAGKSTLGNKLHAYFEEVGRPSYILDGDIIRNFYDNDLGYSNDDRRHNIKRILLAAYVLELNGIIPIVCNISPFEDLRALARRKFDTYIQIYLRKSVREARQSDVKKVYKNNINKTQIVGIDLMFEEPQNSEITLPVDHESVEVSFEKIRTFITHRV